ncbi:hypothetical protein PHYSODRAFT_305546 [Phytophthora sojae]|uniref:Uncharacterized protein n=1 Tax=Phytophthora sojae (strain P6497) TaxID=1094619 RepID=G5A5J4_PHYSP|nr:hypothetical protein PHYSODRAFT_305546 [Phytophthora sojae]EGZ08599.1 hypothetical protein PHYSODRAFT_305546 [Phytophthora sojae]|eukprot:XP_009535232.1 hypothetical protein PHYSODRAFT_305546 [Phytophthora sojae]
MESPPTAQIVEAWRVLDVKNAGPTKQPPKLKKKRLRRQKLEIEFLREEVSRMEGELVRLREKQPVQSAMPTSVASVATQDLQISPTTHNYRRIVPRKKERHFVWKEIAERQFKERWRAQNQNRELRSQLGAEYELGRQMMEVLQRSLVSRGPMPSRLSWNNDDSAVFRRQLLQAERVFISVDMVLQGRKFADPSASFMDTFLQRDEDGDVFVTLSNMVLPLRLNLVANALWDILGSDRMKEYCYDHHVVSKTDNVVTRAFGITYNVDTSTADLRGWYTLQRFVDNARIVIVWIGWFELVELAGLRCRGILGWQEGWIEFREHSFGDNQGTSTLARSQSRLMLETGEGAPNLKQHITALFRHGQSALQSMSAAFGSILEQALVEEDWK